MKVTIGEAGTDKTWQRRFPSIISCDHCKGNAKIAFVAHEGMSGDPLGGPYVCDLYKDDNDGLWPHDCCAVAVYLCTSCLKPKAIFNQA